MEHPNKTKSKAIIGSPAKRHLNGVLLGADGGQTLNACLVALWFNREPVPVFLRNPIAL